MLMKKVSTCPGGEVSRKTLSRKEVSRGGPVCSRAMRPRARRMRRLERALDWIVGWMAGLLREGVVQRWLLARGRPVARR